MNNHDNRNLNEVLINATIIFLLILVSIVIVALPASADSCTGKYKVREDMSKTEELRIIDLEEEEQQKIEREKFSAKHYKLRNIDDKKEYNNEIPPIKGRVRITGSSKKNSKNDNSSKEKEINGNISNINISTVKDKYQVNYNNNSNEVLPMINQNKQNNKLMNISGDDVKLDEINNMMRQIIDEF